MANIRAIKRRIKSSSNISKITKAMQMVAASKMKKAKNLALSGQPYAEKIHEAIAIFSAGVEEKSHPLFQLHDEAKNVLSILVSTNKGLCGGLNSNLFRKSLYWYRDQVTSYITLGRKGRSFVRRSGGFLLADFSDDNFLDAVSAVVELISKEYSTGNYRAVYMSYNSFISALKHVPVRRRILPLDPTMIEREKDDELPKNMIIEPSYAEIFDTLIPHYLETQIRSSILDAEASEHSARMLAMKNATDSAVQLKADLILEFNKIRQQQITFEIADMVTARISVK